MDYSVSKTTRAERKELVKKEKIRQERLLITEDREM